MTTRPGRNPTRRGASSGPGAGPGARLTSFRTSPQSAGTGGGAMRCPLRRFRPGAARAPTSRRRGAASAPPARGQSAVRARRTRRRGAAWRPSGSRTLWARAEAGSGVRDRLLGRSKRRRSSGVAGRVVLDAVRVGKRGIVEHGHEALVVALALELGDDHRATLADAVRQRPALAHDAVDTDHQRDADGDRLGREERAAEGLQRRGEGDQARRP